MNDHRVRRALFLLFFGCAACSIPPASNAEILRTNTPAIPVTISGRLRSGAQVSFGDTSALIESASTSSGNVDLTASSLRDALAVVAATASDVEAVSRDVEAASHVAASHVDLTVHAPGGAPIAHFEGGASERVRRQADAVSRGAARLANAASVVVKGAELAAFLGAILSGPEEPILLKIAADSHGVPYRATCTTKTGESLVEDPRRSISCVIVRADAVPSRSWYLSVDTVRSGDFGELVPQSRGWLKHEPMRPDDTFIWVSRPDTTTKGMRRSYESLSSFTVLKGNAALAGLQVDYTDGPPKAWLTTAAESDEERQAVEVTLAILALAPWPELKPAPSTDSTTKP